MMYRIILIRITSIGTLFLLVWLWLPFFSCLFVWMNGLSLYMTVSFLTEEVIKLCRINNAILISDSLDKCVCIR